jgi:hypothetical protein
MRHTVLTGAQFSLKVDVFGIQVEFRALEIREVDPQGTKGERRCSCSSTAVARCCLLIVPLCMAMILA